MNISKYITVMTRYWFQFRAVMQKCGDSDDCISTPEASELAAAMDENELNSLPLPGQVDFINGGPPCQVC